MSIYDPKYSIKGYDTYFQNPCYPFIFADTEERAKEKAISYYEDWLTPDNQIELQIYKRNYDGGLDLIGVVDAYGDYEDIF